MDISQIAAFSNQELAKDVEQFDRFMHGTRGITRHNSRRFYILTLKGLDTTGKTPLPDKPLDQITADDLLRIRDQTEETYSQTNANNRLIAIRLFFKWRTWRDTRPEALDRRNKEIPPLCKYLTNSRTPNTEERLALQPVLSIEQVKQLLEATRSERDKTLILLTYETGARADEILQTNIEDYYTRDGRRHIRIRESKTVSREVPIEESCEQLDRWIASRPNAKPADPLFVNSNGSRITYSGYLKLFSKSVARAARNHPDFPTKTTIKTLRNSRATQLAQAGATEAFLRKMFGWSRTSRMPSYYVQQAALNLGDMMDRLKGRERKPRTVNGEIYQQILCPNCSTATHGARFCPNCGETLIEAAKRSTRIEELETQVDRLSKALSRLIPEVTRINRQQQEENPG